MIGTGRSLPGAVVAGRAVFGTRAGLSAQLVFGTRAGFLGRPVFGTRAGFPTHAVLPVQAGSRMRPEPGATEAGA
ncbi:hypothetical protein SAMN04489732_120126 [Amycolatopsis saalfeldensis]|uniref:Uncharacterized protein n=1 Tax=Amycolatopsis saalfeldensis TaxID=394193 RepID=A0A1H8YJY8_9PSEU|nr:hypothetical protein SAMN04489732_120126 [Amycolatopsis saalfeldensis]